MARRLHRVVLAAVVFAAAVLDGVACAGAYSATEPIGVDAGDATVDVLGDVLGGDARGDPESGAVIGHLCVIGGMTTVDGGKVPLAETIVAPIHADGTLGAWLPTSTLPEGLVAASAAKSSGTVYVLGGQGDGGAARADVLFANIRPDGALDPWAPTRPFQTPRSWSASVASGDFLYVVGGYSTSSPLADVQVARLAGDAGIGRWDASAPLPSTRHAHGAAANGSFVYVTGGASGAGMGEAPSDTVYFGVLRGDGRVDSWTTSPRGFSTKRGGHASIVHGNRLYVLGGLSDQNAYLSDVQVARLNPDGTIAAWSFTESFAQGRFAHAAVAFGDFLYVLGGAHEFLTMHRDVQVARIRGDGTLDPWAQTTPLPTTRYVPSAVAY